MFQRFYPKESYVSTYDIPFEKYYEKGYRLVLFDIDNTLVEHDQPATEDAIQLFEWLRSLGFSTCLISNNKDYRVQPFADAVKSEFVYKAGKPAAGGYEEAMKRMKVSPEQTLFVGDQVFTDVWGANRAGVHSILVKQIAKHEEIQIVFKRKLEKVVLSGYWRKHGDHPFEVHNK